jgi:hypothetical protein
MGIIPQEYIRVPQVRLRSPNKSDFKNKCFVVVKRVILSPKSSFRCS